MTITAELYEEINSRLVGVLESYKEELTQYDMLIIAVNLLVSYMEVVVQFDQIPRHQLFNEVVELLKTRKTDDFVSRN